MPNVSQNIKNNLISISHTVNHLEIDINILEQLEKLQQYNKWMLVIKYIDKLVFERIIINCCKLVSSSKSEKHSLERIANFAIENLDEKRNYITQVEGLIHELEILQLKTIRDKFIAHSDDKEIFIKTSRKEFVVFVFRVIETSKMLLELSNFKHIDYSLVKDEINDFLNPNLNSVYNEI